MLKMENDIVRIYCKFKLFEGLISLHSVIFQPLNSFFNG